MKHTLFNALLVPALTFASLTFSTTAAQAGGRKFPQQSCAATSNFALAHGADQLNVVVSEGDVVAVNNMSMSSFPSRLSDSRMNSVSPAPASYAVPAGVTSVNITSGSGQMGDGSLTISCTLAADVGAQTSSALLTNTASIIGANSQINATYTGVSNNAKGRLNGNSTTRNLVTNNTLFFSSQNLPGADKKFGNPDWSAWVSAEGRSYSGSIDGWSADIVTGVDKLVRDDLIIGALLGVGRVEVRNATQSADVNSVAVGAYFAKRFQNDLFLDGFISVARPDYKVDGASFNSNRSSLALSLTGSFTGDKVKLTPSGTLSAYREKLPAYVGNSGAVASSDVSNLNLNIGAKIESLAAMANGILPYISLSVDYGSYDNGLSGSQSFFAPRIGVGFGADLGGGYLSVDLDAGEVQDDIRDFGLRASYEFNF